MTLQTEFGALRSNFYGALRMSSFGGFYRLCFEYFGFSPISDSKEKNALFRKIHSTVFRENQSNFSQNKSQRFKIKMHFLYNFYDKTRLLTHEFFFNCREPSFCMLQVGLLTDSKMATGLHQPWHWVLNLLPPPAGGCTLRIVNNNKNK